jgi:hypothetical protein
MAVSRTPTLVLVAFTACAPVRPAAVTQEPPTAPAPIVASATVTSAAAIPLDAASPRARFQRTHTGQDVPRVVVHNHFLRVQHVFVDWRPVGTVGMRASATFDVPVGTHTITCADSPRPTDDPGSVTELFESGYTYTYEVLAE